MELDRNTLNPQVVGGRPFLRGMRVTVGTIVGRIASGHSNAEILSAYPYVGAEDLRQALPYAAWRVEELEVPFLWLSPPPSRMTNQGTPFDQVVAELGLTGADLAELLTVKTAHASPPPFSNSANSGAGNARRM